MNDEKFTEAEITEMQNIKIVMKTCIDALVNIDSLIGNRQLAMELKESYLKCTKIYQGRVPRSELKQIAEEIYCAKNTIEKLNELLQHPVESDFTRDLQVAWWNMNQIAQEHTEYKEY